MPGQDNENDQKISYTGSPAMLNNRVYNNTGSNNKSLKEMSIDRRWECDNRIPTWNFGVMNFGFDQNFIHKGNIIDDTDEFTLNLTDDVETENGPLREVVGVRKIKFNGSWFNIK